MESCFFTTTLLADIFHTHTHTLARKDLRTGKGGDLPLLKGTTTSCAATKLPVHSDMMLINLRNSRQLLCHCASLYSGDRSLANNKRRRRQRKGQVEQLAELAMQIGCLRLVRSFACLTSRIESGKVERSMHFTRFKVSRASLTIEIFCAH